MAAMDNITSSDIYQSTLGSRHIFIAVEGWNFNRWHPSGGLATSLERYEPEWTKQYNSRWWEDDMTCFVEYAKGERRLKECDVSVFKNNILARERDMWAIRRMHEDEKRDGGGDFTDLVEQSDPIPTFGFSFGLVDSGDIGDVPLLTASYAKYQRSEWTYFYHSRSDPSTRNSTMYRLAPMTRLPANGTEGQSTYQRSSIGFDMEPAEWLEQLTKSKFCLVIRGDNPISRALLRSVRVGCIPVVISDLYPMYAPSYRSTLNFTDYTILIDEQDFIANPWGELHRVYSTLSEEDARRKLKALAFAQRVIFPDHPDSLFVEAFLNEAWQSIPDEERSVGCGTRQYYVDRCEV